MIELGILSFSGEVKVLKARQLLLTLAEHCGYNEITATRLATLCSATASRLTMAGERMLRIGLIETDGQYALALQFPAEQDKTVLAPLESLLKQTAAENSPHYLPLPSTEFHPTDDFIKQAKDILAKRSVEELIAELELKNKTLKSTQAQMLQSEKMASVGQLAAGVAHEINNPMGFITSNLGSLQKYIAKLHQFIDLQTETLADLNAEDRIKEARKKLKIDFLFEDTDDLLTESLSGAKRVSEIVKNLKSFSRVDAEETALTDLNDCLDSTLKVIWNELKYKAKIVKEYADLPQTLCNPQELNQVFINILINAAHAIEEKGEICLRTWVDGEWIKVALSDTGQGIPADKLERIFEPFYTTKPVGKGTGLGLSICYDLIKKIGGDIQVASKVGHGTTFTLSIPLKISADKS